MVKVGCGACQPVSIESDRRVGDRLSHSGNRTEQSIHIASGLPTNRSLQEAVYD